MLYVKIPSLITISSKSYNFPIGSQLNDKIKNLLNDENITYKIKSKEGQLHEFNISNLINEATSFSIDELRAFCEDLRNYPSDSIDNFLFYRKDKDRFIEIGKTAIAMIISLHEDEKLLRSSGDDWMQELFDIMVKDCDYENFGNNNIYFISFNYDRSLEYYFHFMLKHKFDINDRLAMEMVKKLRILHMHGKIGNFEFEDTEFYNSYKPILNDNMSLPKLSNEIKIIYDHVDEEGINKFIMDAFNNVIRVYFLGFGFDEFNVFKRLKINKYSNLEHVHPEDTTLNISPSKLRSINDKLHHFKLTNRDMKCLEFLKNIANLD